MKVVLFCGGLGMRLREYSETVPKPMINIGYRPILWHVMKYYAHFGHKDFVICLGYKADVIKNYFLNYDECVSNDFTLSCRDKKIELANCDTENWKITFVDTGINSNIGQRLMAVKSYLKTEKVFLANYSDNLTDFHLPKLIDCVSANGKAAGFICVRPSQSFHIVTADGQGKVHKIHDVKSSDMWINGGCFVLRNEIFDYMKDGDELVVQPFRRLIEANKLFAYKHDGFWASMDTFKDKQCLDDMYLRGEAIWKVWEQNSDAQKQQASFTRQ